MEKLSFSLCSAGMPATAACELRTAEELSEICEAAVFFFVLYRTSCLSLAGGGTDFNGSQRLSPETEKIFTGAATETMRNSEESFSSGGSG